MTTATRSAQDTAAAFAAKAYAALPKEDSYAFHKQISEWREITKREFVHSFKSAQRTPNNDTLFAKANLLPMLQRGTPKASAIHGLCLALQSDTMSRQGIDHLFV